MGDVEIPTYCDDEREYFNDEFQDTAIEINGEVYSVDRDAVDQENDIYSSIKNDDGTISFEVKYYNGGCGFGEALETALK